MHGGDVLPRVSSLPLASQQVKHNSTRKSAAFHLNAAILISWFLYDYFDKMKGTSYFSSFSDQSAAGDGGKQIS